MFCLSAGAMMMLGVNAGYAQKMKKIDEVSYLQLPAKGNEYAKARIYLFEDNSLFKTLGMGGMMAGVAEKAGLDGEALSEAIEKALKEQNTTYYRSIDLFSIPTLQPASKKELKVIITYAPDDGARPMGDPMKDKNGFYTFQFRAYAAIKVYDPTNKEIYSRDWGVIVGTGKSKKWTGNQPKGMVQTGADAEWEHPYAIACKEGIVDQAEKELIGRYGASILFTTPGVYEIKSLKKKSAEIASQYNAILENKAMPCLTNEEKKQMQACVDYWVSNKALVPEKEAWCIDYNIALGYTWLEEGDRAKPYFDAASAESIASLDKIISKKTFVLKDLNRVEYLNLVQPFIEYYPAGRKKYPQVPCLMPTGPIHVVPLYLLQANYLISGAMGIYAPIQIIPAKKGSKPVKGSISKDGVKLLTFGTTYNKNGFIESFSYTGVKEPFRKLEGGKAFSIHETKGYVVSLGGYDYAEKGVTHPNFQLQGEMNFPLHYTRDEHGFTTYSDKIITCLSLLRPEGVEMNKQSDGLPAEVRVKFSDDFAVEGFTAIQQSPDDYGFLMDDEKKMYITPHCARTSLELTAEKPDEHGNPMSYTVVRKCDQVSLRVYSLFTKFGMETSKERTVRDKMVKDFGPKIETQYLNAIKAQGVTVTKVGKGYSMVKKETFPVTYTYDGQGNCTGMTINGYTITL